MPEATPGVANRAIQGLADDGRRLDATRADTQGPHADTQGSPRGPAEGAIEAADTSPGRGAVLRHLLAAVAEADAAGDGAGARAALQAVAALLPVIGEASPVGAETTPAEVVDLASARR